MNTYPPFKNKLENLSEDKQFRVLISFEDLSNREKFIKKNDNLEIVGKIDIIPSILVNLNKVQISSYEKEGLIKNIEEDQFVYPAMLDLIEILELDQYRNSQISYSGKNVKVGIIDNGIDINFPAISNISIKKYTMSENEKIRKEYGEKKEITHATIMASIIANRFVDRNNNYIGIAPNVTFFDFNITDSEQEYSLFHILNAFDKIYKDRISLDILLISFTTKNPSDGNDLLSLACDLLAEKGIIIVCPAGNYGPNAYTIGSPSAARKVITIGALTKELKIPNFSGKGPTLDEREKPDLYFPGSNVVIPINNDLRIRVSGTSVSAAIGIGIIALIKEYDPKISFDALMDLLNESSIDLDSMNNSQSLRTLKVSRLFSKLDLFHEKLLPYDYLAKKSLRLSIEFLILFVIVFYFLFFFRI